MIKDIVIGFVLSILTTLAGSYIYLEYVMHFSFEKNLEMIIDSHNQGLVLTYGALPNILLFFVFLKRKEDYKARGVVMGIILTTFVVFGYNFL